MRKSRDLTKWSLGELERERQDLQRKISKLEGRSKDIDGELQARRTGRPARQPYPYTAQERAYLAADNIRCGLVDK